MKLKSLVILSILLGSCSIGTHWEATLKVKIAGEWTSYTDEFISEKECLDYCDAQHLDQDFEEVICNCIEVED